MRKNTARHWLHAGLDLLPLILIPVFMIYSHRHTIDSGSIDVPVNRVVDFNSRVVNSYYNSRTVEVSINSFESGEGAYLGVADTPIINGHKYAFKGLFDTTNIEAFYMAYSAQNNLINGGVFVASETQSYASFCAKVIPNSSVSYSFYPCCYDLTQMFGAGNEPTYDEFVTYFPNDFYDYVDSKNVLVKNYSTVTYDDTDIMSQFTYQMYNAVDKYFNMGNVFGMSNVYDWFNLNIFGGNASISIYIVWNIVLYEFVMDLLFLLYALFMWFIDVTKRLIEKPLDSIK